MAWCRFDSDSQNCDVYAYTTFDDHVIVVRHERFEVDLPDEDTVGPQEFRELMARTARIALDHPDAGETFTFVEFEDFARKMEELHADGLRIPDDTMAEIRHYAGSAPNASI